MDRIFRPTDILIPADGDMARWSVIACDQFSSQPGYWDALDEYVGDAPSTSAPGPGRLRSASARSWWTSSKIFPDPAPEIL